MVKLVALIGHDHCVNDFAEGLRAGINVDDRKPVRLREIRAQHRCIGNLLRRRLHRQLCACMEGRVRMRRHGRSSFILATSPMIEELRFV
jgi:hypothetical protein